MLKRGLYIFVARQKIVDLKYNDIRNSLLKSLKRVKVIKDEKR